MQMAASDPGALSLIIFGLLLSVGGLLVQSRRLNDLAETFNRLAYLAQDGRPEEARVEARALGKALRPLLDALSGDLTAPSPRAWLDNAIAVTVMHLPSLLLVAYGATSVRSAEMQSRLPSTVAFFVALAIVWPIALASSVAFIVQSRRSARALRATCIALVAKGVKAQVDHELSESLRRGGGANRDPRGE